MSTTRAFFSSLITALVVVACDPGESELGPNGRRGSGNGGAADENGDGTAATDPNAPGNCKEGTPHPGFANNDFVSDRKPGAIGADRRRVKPYSAIRTEMQRALGQVPASLATNAAAFGDTPARWFAEPTAGAVSLFTTYGIAFTGCYDTMAGATYGAAPTTQTAGEECAKMQRKFWQRTPSADETKACVDLAVTELASEATPRRRWAHVCASILTAAGFTTY